MKLEGGEETGTMLVWILSLLVKGRLDSSRYVLEDLGHHFHGVLELVVDGQRLELEDVKGYAGHLPLRGNAPR